MKKCIEINLTKKTIEMIENIRGNLVEFAVALLRAGRGLKSFVLPHFLMIIHVALLRAGRGLKSAAIMPRLRRVSVALLRAGRGLKLVLLC